MSWEILLKKEVDAYVVKDSIWKEAYGLLGANDRDISTGHLEPSFEEIERALNRKLTPHDFAFFYLNFKGDVEKHLGLSNYKIMLQLFTDKGYQIESLEGGRFLNTTAVSIAESDILSLSRKRLQEELERLK